MKILTKRTEIAPLGLDELKTIIQSRAEFERMVKCNVSGLNLPSAYRAELTEMLEQKDDLWLNKSSEYMFHTLWTMIDRELKAIVGFFTINGKPNAQGEVEVFFTVEQPHQRKGYGYEVMQGILKWASANDLFKTVFIEADFDNKAAMASLKKLGFRQVLEYDEDHSVTKHSKYYIKVTKPENIDTEELDFD